ncbi:MAG: roadblock/LC7 domain-containing protein [Candidatus Obscuribacterales bacterium]|nr:roadblock/LC7 domain-containing protein [Candidatus Obscuribacterales bacterium]
MYKISFHPNTTLFVLTLAAAIAGVIFLPQLYPDFVVELPLIAFYAGECGLALLLALLFYENASTDQAVQISGGIIGFTMAVGVVGNLWGGFTGQSTRMLPETFVLINWVQLGVMNVAGVLATVSILKLELKDQYKFVVGTIVKDAEAVRRVATPQDVTAKVEEAPEKAEDFAVPGESVVDPTAFAQARSTESVKDILEKLDVERIDALEKQINPEQVSLEHLFGEESRAAQAAKDASGEGKGKELKDFGRLNPKAAKPDSQPPGTMRTIGKMLLDSQAVETIIRSGEQGGLSTAKIITEDKGQELTTILQKLRNFPGVTGCLIVGHDGLVISSTLESDMDSFSQGAMALAVFSPSGNAIKKLEFGNLKQLIAHTADKLTVFSEVPNGILIVFSDYAETGSIVGLLDAVSALKTST